MDIQPQSQPGLRRVAQLIDGIRVAMLTTVSPDGRLRSRPLVTVQMDAEGGIWFFMSISSPKVAEIDAHRRVSLSYAQPGRQNFVSVSGVTQVIRDDARARALWSPVLAAWLPQGMDDPDVALLRVLVEEAEYWETPAGAVQRFFDFAGGPRHEKIHIPG